MNTEFVLERVQSDPDVTIGELTIGGKHICWTCEDPEREVAGMPVEQWKIPGQTAIPRGSYRVVLTYSPRFQVSLPLLEDVPGFAGIRIHPGNDAGDTDGCILPGLERRPNGVGQSRLAYIELRKWLDAVWRNDDEAVMVIRGPQPVEATGVQA